VNAPGCTVHGRAGVTPSIESFFTLHWPCMNAVVCSESFSARLELKSAALTLMAVVLRTTELDALADELEQRASVMPGLFDDEPVAIDLACVRDAEQPLDFDALVALLRRHRMRPLAVRGGTPEQMAAAVAAGLLEAPEGARARSRARCRRRPR
jgi:septum site-determining protein MinC